MHHRRHRARRNPSLLGFTLPPTMEIVGVAGGLIGTPILTNYVWNNFLAGTSMGTSKWAYLGVEAVTVAGSGMLIKKFAGPRIGAMYMLGGAVRVALDLVQTLMPTLIPSTAMPTGLSGMGSQPFLGYYEKRPMLANPGLGKYYTGPRAGSNQGRMIQQVPERLDPSARF